MAPDLDARAGAPVCWLMLNTPLRIANEMQVYHYEHKPFTQASRKAESCPTETRRDLLVVLQTATKTRQNRLGALHDEIDRPRGEARL